MQALHQDTDSKATRGSPLPRDLRRGPVPPKEAAGVPRSAAELDIQDQLAIIRWTSEGGAEPPDAMSSH
jgi:hypothetical protein